MDIRKQLGIAALGLTMALIGCGDDDNGNGGPTDAGPGDDGFEALPALMAGGEPADYTCLGERTAPETGDSSTFTLEVRDFQTGDPVPGVCVNMYSDNQVPESDTCGGNMTDEAGNIELTDPDGGWFAYRIFPTATNLGVVQVNNATPADGGSADGNSVSTTTASLIPGLLGRSRDEDAAIFSGALYDCNNATVEGGAFRVLQGGSVVPEGPLAEDAMYAYFGGSDLPSPDQPYTNTNGLYLGINIPVQTEGEVVQLVACGKPDGENLEVLGCEETRSFANTVNILSLFPTRSDGPSCPDICNE
jgi:hypothetical protein